MGCFGALYVACVKHSGANFTGTTRISFRLRFSPLWYSHETYSFAPLALFNSISLLIQVMVPSADQRRTGEG